MQHTKQVQAAATAAMRAAARKGMDPYNSADAAGRQYARVAAMRSERDANRQLARQ